MRPEIRAARAAYGVTQARVLAVLRGADDAMTARMIAERVGMEVRRVLNSLERRGCVECYWDSEMVERRGRTEVKWFRFLQDLPPPNRRTEYFRAYYAKRKQSQQTNGTPNG